MKIKLSLPIIEDIVKNMNDSKFSLNGLSYILKIGDKELGSLKIDYNKKNLIYEITDFSYDGIMRRTIFGDAWMKYLDT